MRFTTAHGTPAEQRNARGAHILLLDSPLDLSPAVKDFMPYLDWGDQGGVTTLSYEDTMACIGRFLALHYKRASLGFTSETETAGRSKARTASEPRM